MLSSDYRKIILNGGWSEWDSNYAEQEIALPIGIWGGKKNICDALLIITDTSNTKS